MQGGETLRSEIHKLINSLWSKEELLEQRNEYTIVPIYEKGRKTDCSNFQGISLLSPSYNTLSSILVSRLGPYVDEIIGDNQCEF
jgi:hypothetical protein